MYTRQQLNLKTIKRLKTIATDLNIHPAGDKRLKSTWIEAILLHQPQEQPQPQIKSSCATCPFASLISGDRYLCTANPDMVATGGKVVRGHWDTGVDCEVAIAAHQEAEVEYVQQLEAKHEADFNRSTEKVPTQDPSYDIEGFTVRLFPCQSVNRLWGWDAEIYNPHKQERHPLGFWHSTPEEALDDASGHIRMQLREQTTVEALAPVVAKLQESGVSVAEILNGLAELFYRQDDCPDLAIRYLEDASSACC